MTISNPITQFGIHQAVIKNRTTHQLSTLLVVGDFGPAFKQADVKLYGGSSAFPWDTAAGNADATVSLTVKQFDLAAFKYFAGDSGSNYTEDSDGDPTGYVSALTNKIGTSVFSATTGIASAGIVTSGNPKFGGYYVKAASATTVDVYLDNSIDGVPVIDDNLKITASPLTITTGAAVTIPGTDLKLTGGSGTIAMTTADIAYFSARPQNNYYSEYQIGANGVVKPEFDLQILAEKTTTGIYRVLHMPRVKSDGFTIKGAEKAWATFDTTLTVLKDVSLGYAARYITVGR